LLRYQQAVDLHLQCEIVERREKEEEEEKKKTPTRRDGVTEGVVWMPANPGLTGPN
jgi:hypothetical protein